LRHSGLVPSGPPKGALVGLFTVHIQFKPSELGRLSKLSYLKPHLSFYAGLIVGGAVSLAIYILVFAAFLSGVLQALVAAGTLAVASITGYITVRDRREALAREMADRVYVPMRKQSITWQDPEPSGVLPSWDKLKQDLPYLTSRIDAKLTKTFDRAEQLRNQMGILITPVDEALTAEIQRSTPVGDYGVGKAPMPRIRVLRGFSKFGDFDVKLLAILLFKTGESLDQFVSDHMAMNRPDVSSWYVEFYYPLEQGIVETLSLDKSKVANNWFDHLLKSLDSNSEALRLRADYRELKALGAEATKTIDKELRKPVAPMISGQTA